METTGKALAHDAAATMRRSYSGLANVSLAPVIAFLACSIIVYAFAASGRAGALFFFDLIGTLALFWLLFNVTRWHLRERGVEVQEGELGIYGSYIFYTLAIMAFFALVGIFAYMAGLIVAMFVADLFGEIGLLVFGGALLALVGLFALLVGVRYYIAMPAVMIGQRPGIGNLFTFAEGFTRRVVWYVLPVCLIGMAINYMAGPNPWGGLPLPQGAVVFQVLSWIYTILAGIFTSLLFANAYMAVLEVKGPIGTAPDPKPAGDPILPGTDRPA